MRFRGFGVCPENSKTGVIFEISRIWRGQNPKVIQCKSETHPSTHFALYTRHCSTLSSSTPPSLTAHVRSPSLNVSRHRGTVPDPKGAGEHARGRPPRPLLHEGCREKWQQEGPSLPFVRPGGKSGPPGSSVVRSPSSSRTRDFSLAPPPCHPPPLSLSLSTRKGASVEATPWRKRAGLPVLAAPSPRSSGPFGSPRAAG